MRAVLLLLMASWAQAQTFAVASVKASQSLAGPDANNRIRYLPGAFSARNATLRRLIAEAWRLQVRQVIGPSWLDHDEYDVEAKAAGAVVPAMLQTLLKERFGLVQHRDTRRMRAYELVVDRGGPKVQPLTEVPPQEAQWPHFRGDMQRFADLLAVQLSIPTTGDPTRPAMAGGPTLVLDKTALPGIYELEVGIRPDGSDVFALWQRVLREKMGLRLENRPADVEVLVVDEARKAPVEN